jgi:allene oxide cyclase
MRHQRSIALGTASLLLVGGAAVVGAGVWTAEGSGLSSDRAAHRGWAGTSSRSPAALVHAAKAAAAREGTHVLTVVEIENGDGTYVDVGESGESAGDYFLFEGRLMSADGTTQVGRDSGRCMIGARTYTCDATASIFNKGKIVVSGAFFRESDTKLAVTGGTGRFKDVGGQLTVTDTADGNSLLIFELTD